MARTAFLSLWASVPFGWAGQLLMTTNTTPISPSHGSVPWRLPKKCFSFGKPKSSWQWVMYKKFSLRLHWPGAPSAKCTSCSIFTPEAVRWLLAQPNATNMLVVLPFIGNDHHGFTHGFRTSLRSAAVVCDSRMEGSLVIVPMSALGFILVVTNVVLPEF